MSDYIKGLYRYHIASGALTPLESDCDCTLSGIDGLYYYETRLIALHNGTNPKRVMIYQLDGDRVIGSEIIAQGGESLNEPTQGVIVDNEFYFIGNSPWTAYAEDGTFQTPDSKTKIFRYSLN